MSKKLEDRLALLEAELAQAKRKPEGVAAAAPVRISRRRWKILAVLAGLLLAASASWYIVLRPTQPVPAKIIQRAGFTVYYPSELPNGYRIDADSFDLEGGTVLFTVSGTKKHKLIISQQARPSNLDVKKFNKEHINQGTAVITPNGEAVIGVLGPNLVVSILTEDTWILINDPSHGDRKILSQIAKNLTPAE